MKQHRPTLCRFPGLLKREKKRKRKEEKKKSSNLPIPKKTLSASPPTIQFNKPLTPPSSPACPCSFQHGHSAQNKNLSFFKNF
jgi:hypothetical protein